LSDQMRYLMIDGRTAPTRLILRGKLELGRCSEVELNLRLLYMRPCMPNGPQTPKKSSQNTVKSSPICCGKLDIDKWKTDVTNPK